MVVLSSVICNKRGKILVARQYRPTSKLQLEEAISNFPKMIISEQQHTFIEDDKIRYVYLPMESLYLVLLTSKTSNIIEDIEIARLLYKVVLRVTEEHGVNERGIVFCAFDLILAFDDVITIGGYRESVTLQQIGQYLEMDSQDEKAHLQARKEQEDEAKATTNEKLKIIIQREKEEQLRKMGQGGAGYAGGVPSSSGGLASKFGRGEEAEESSMSSTFGSSKEDFIPKPQEPVRGSGGLSLGRGGIQLKKKQEAASDYFEPIMQQFAGAVEEEKFVDAQEEPESLLKMNIDISVEEKLAFTVAKDGEVEKLELKGTLYLTVNNPKFAQAAIVLTKSKHPKCKQGGLTHAALKIKASPELDRARWDEALTLSAEEQFQIGTKIPALSYRYSSTDENALPFSLGVWESGNRQQLTLELEANDESLLKFKTFTKADLRVPLARAGAAEVTSLKNGEYAATEDALILRAKDWQDKGGSLFKLKCHNSAALFPIVVSCEEEWSVLGWQVASAHNASGEEPSVSFKTRFTVENSQISN